MKIVLECVERACERAANKVRLEMQRGLSGLAAVAATAVWLGFIGTVPGVADSFRGGTAGERATALGAIAGYLGDSLVPAGAGVIIAVTAWSGHRYLRERLEGLDMEMRNAAIDLVNQLSRPVVSR
jgi:biopolymer transport protein ExbB/TolQ